MWVTNCFLIPRIWFLAELIKFLINIFSEFHIALINCGSVTGNILSFFLKLNMKVLGLSPVKRLEDKIYPITMLLVKNSVRFWKLKFILQKLETLMMNFTIAINVPMQTLHDWKLSPRTWQKYHGLLDIPSCILKWPELCAKCGWNGFGFLWDHIFYFSSKIITCLLRANRNKSSLKRLLNSQGCPMRREEIEKCGAS